MKILLIDIYLSQSLFRITAWYEPLNSKLSILRFYLTNIKGQQKKASWHGKEALLNSSRSGLLIVFPEILTTCSTRSSWLCSTFLALFGSMFNTFTGTDGCTCLCCTAWTILAWILSLLLISLCGSFYSKRTCGSLPYDLIPPYVHINHSGVLLFICLFALFINEKSLGLMGALLVIFTKTF